MRGGALLDLPIQHCNDTILKNMNRRSNRAELLEVIGKLRREIPGITLRTTLIAGFPGETIQAVQGVHPAPHPHLHLHQQDGPRSPRPL